MEIGKGQPASSPPAAYPTAPLTPHFLKVSLMCAQGSRRSFWRKLSSDSQEAGVGVGVEGVFLCAHVRAPVLLATMLRGEKKLNWVFGAEGEPFPSSLRKACVNESRPVFKFAAYQCQGLAGTAGLTEACLLNGCWAAIDFRCPKRCHRWLLWEPSLSV
jgi:hypothetical protein